ncbi:MAG: carboxypeptidase regulatory-like domain-containing protein [Pyrinomonadaceae bacterium]
MKKRVVLMTRLYSLALAIGLAAILSISASAQTSSLRGTVRDSQGASVSGATVTLQSETKSYSRTQVSNEDGNYSFVSIPPDTYRVEVVAKGFKKSLLPGLQAMVDLPKEVNIALEPGGITETVTVTTSNEAVLNTSDGSIGNTFTTQQVIQLPLSARNTPGLLSLQPGVTADGEVNGGRSDQANVTLDGVDVNEQQGGRAFFSVLRVTPEALQEFRVQTTNADASFGRSSGAQISLITKSGSNEWHGSGYFYYRPKTWLQANDFFNNANGVAQPSVERRNYGGSFLGPIIKDRLFFAAFYERFDENTETSVTREVPLASLGMGIVKYRASAAPGAGTCTPTFSGGVSSLTIAQINACYNGANGVTPGVNNTAVMFLAAAAARYTANDTTVGDGLNTSGFRFNAKTPIRNNVATLRLDWKVNASQDVFARYQYQQDNSSGVSRFPDTPAPNNWNHPQGISLGHTWTINSSMVNRFTYGLTRAAFTNGGDSAQNFVSFRFIYQPLSFSRTLSRVTPVHNFVDDFTWVMNNHTISAGGNIRLVTNARASFGSSYDNASTNPSYYNCSGDVVIYDDATCGTPIFPNVASGGTTDLRDALTAVIGRFSQYGAALQYGASGSLQPVGQAVSRTFKTEEYEWYVQDSWRAFNNLTVNYGVRWSTGTPVYEANGLQVTPTTSLNEFFEKRAAGAFNGTPYNGLLTVDKAGKANGKPGYYKQDFNNFAPSVAVAWSPNFKGGFLKALFGGDNKSTIRGGFRVTYDRIGSALAVAFDLNSTLGYSSASSISANTYDVASFQGPLFSGLGQNYRILPGITAAPSLTFPLQTPADEDQRIEQSLDDKLTTPYNYNYNVSYGREIYKGLSFEASYVGRIAKSLLVIRDTAHFNNLRDPASGQDFYGVMNTLLDYRAGNAPITSIPNMAWFNKFVPGLAGTYTICGVPTALTATQAAYRRVARASVNNTGACLGGRNTEDYTFVQLLWDDGLGFGNNIFIHPQYATFAAYSTIGTSWYNSFQFSLRKRFQQGLSFDINYTYSHSIDTASGNEASGSITGVNYLNPLNANANKGNSDFDVRHLVNANYIYELPFGRGKMFFGTAGKVVNALIGGWTLTGIVRWNTGLPTGEPFDDARWATNWNVQSNLVRVKQLYSSPVKNGTGGIPNLFSNPTAAYQSFRNARPGEAGDRNILRDPGYATFDAGLYKSVGITERAKLTFRLEVFNVANHQSLTGVSGLGSGVDPYLNTPSSSFGRLTAIQGAPRVVQGAVRIDF